ncbi:MAG: hypothetical protein NTY53_26125 [Kiritimatiellaeota bacterium]|nr:hypothetical protein [Kiritimatiellota bacterium]
MSRIEPEKRGISWGEVVLIGVALLFVALGIYLMVSPSEMFVEHPGSKYTGGRGSVEHLSKDAVRIYGGVGFGMGILILWVTKHFSRYK